MLTSPPHTYPPHTPSHTHPHTHTLTHIHPHAHTLTHIHPHTHTHTHRCLCLWRVRDHQSVASVRIRYPSRTSPTNPSWSSLKVQRIRLFNCLMLECKLKLRVPTLVSHPPTHTHRKLTLDSLRWIIFDGDENTINKQFVQLVQEQLNPKEVSAQNLTAST